MLRSTRPRRFGFTVVELMVATGTIATLIALLLPAVQQVREASRRIACQNNLRQLGLALSNYQATAGVLPPGKIGANNYGSSGSACDPEETIVEDNPSACTEYQSWSTLCLPFFDQTNLADQFDDLIPWSHLSNREVVSTHLKVFICPSTPDGPDIDQYHVRGASSGDYSVLLEVKQRVYTDTFGIPNPGLSARLGTLAEHRANRLRDVTDGTSQTIMLAESSGRPNVYVLGQLMTAALYSAYTDDEVVQTSTGYTVEDGIGWADPDAGFDIKGVNEDGVTIFGPRFINGINTDESYSFHDNGAHFLFADGSVHFLSEDLDGWTFITLCTRAGHEHVGDF